MASSCLFSLPLFSWFGSYLAAVLVEIYTGKAQTDFNCVLDEARVSSAGVLNGENGTSGFRVRESVSREMSRGWGGEIGMRQKVPALKVREITGTPRSRCTERKHPKSLFRQDTAARHKGTTQLRSRNKTK